jgi:hypothetical protein
MIDGYVITFGENGNRLPDVCLPASVVLFVSSGKRLFSANSRLLIDSQHLLALSISTIY